MQNLTVDQQLKLWSILWKFADEELPSKANLTCIIISKNNIQEQTKG